MAFCWTDVVLPFPFLFLVYQHKERLYKYRGMRHLSTTSIKTHICLVLKDFILGKLFGVSWCKGFRQLIDVRMVTAISICKSLENKTWENKKSKLFASLHRNPDNKADQPMHVIQKRLSVLFAGNLSFPAIDLFA